MGVVNSCLSRMSKTDFVFFFSYVKCIYKIMAHFELVCVTLYSIAVVSQTRCFLAAVLLTEALWGLLYYFELPLSPRSSNIQAQQG